MKQVAFTGIRDYNGEAICRGDWLRHPAGDEFIVSHFDNDRSCWICIYTDAQEGAPGANLMLQVGEKGQAVLISDRDYDGKAENDDFRTFFNSEYDKKMKA